MQEANLKKRFLLSLILLGAITLAILIQYGLLMLSPKINSIDNVPIRYERGPILDRKGRILATQTRVYNVVAWRPSITEPANTAKILSQNLGTVEAETLERLTLSEGAVILKRGLSKPQADALSEVISQNGLKGIRLEDDVGRMYPQDQEASHIVGFIGADGHGLDGLELAYDKELLEGGGAASDGTIYGSQLVTTIDLDIQTMLEKTADRAYLDNKADGLVMVVTDSISGDILGLVSRPGYNISEYHMSTPEQRRNRAINYVYEPGSVFKVFTISGILNSGKISANTQFITSKGYTSALFKDPITDLSDYGTITTGGIIEHSSNVGAAFASDVVSNEDFLAMLKSFGFGEKTGIELNGEEKGLLKSLSDWSPRTKPTLAFGQEIGVTAMQIVRAATVLANDGTMIQPHIVKKVISPNGNILSEKSREPVRQVISKESAQTMRAFMNKATETGTATRSRVSGIDISVKTGTSQLIDPKTGSYSKDSFIASSLAIFPTQKPQLIVYVAIFHPRGEKIYGGQIAAPLIKEIAEFLIPYANIDREGDLVVESQSHIEVQVPSLPNLDTTVPNFKGLPKRVLMPLLSTKKYTFIMHGNGWVQSQTPLPGTPLVDGMTIDLVLGSKQE